MAQSKNDIIFLEEKRKENMLNKGMKQCTGECLNWKNPNEIDGLICDECMEKEMQK